MILLRATGALIAICGITAILTAADRSQSDLKVPELVTRLADGYIASFADKPDLRQQETMRSTFARSFSEGSRIPPVL